MRALRAKSVLTRQRALRAYVVTCQNALRAYVLTCLHALHAYVLMCQCTLRSYVLMCQCALRAYVPTCLACLRAHLRTCLACLRAHVPCRDKRNPQHQIVSNLIASQIIKNYTLNLLIFFLFYSLDIIQLQIISHYVIS